MWEVKQIKLPNVLFMFMDGGGGAGKVKILFTLLGKCYLFSCVTSIYFVNLGNISEIYSNYLNIEINITVLYLKSQYLAYFLALDTVKIYSWISNEKSHITTFQLSVKYTRILDCWCLRIYFLTVYWRFVTPPLPLSHCLHCYADRAHRAPPCCQARTQLPESHAPPKPMSKMGGGGGEGVGGLTWIKRYTYL